MDHFRSLILRWFVPAELFAEAEVRRQAYRAVVFGLAMLIWVPVFAPIYLWMDSPRAAMLVGLVSIAIVLSICSLRFSKSVALAGNLLAGAVFAVLVGLACVSGGIAAASLWWLPSVPIIGLVICGVRSGMAWAIGSCVACVVFLTAALFGITLEDDISPEHHQLLDCAGACGIVLCAFILTFAFRRSEAEAREDLTIARDAAERANRAKSVFLENMSHEMRTPMNAIIGMTDLTLRSELRGTERGYLEVVRESSESLLALIDNILDYSKLDTSGFALAREPLDPRAVAVATIETFRSRADRRGLELACHVQADVPRLVVGDQKRLRQVLANLVDNAIKFTDRGRVALDVRCRKATDDGVDLSFSVSDTGIGIAADKQQVIFDLFEKADMSSTRRFGGAGLGLAISSQLVRRMGGGIEVESELGRGSTFRFTASFGPAARGSLEAGPPASPQPGDVRVPRRILLVEDGLVNQRLAATVLEKAGHMVTVASNGREALEAVAARTFDLVLMDVQMPVMDGLAATRVIRDQEQGTGRRLPIIALTSQSFDEDRDQCLEAGMDNYIAKPIRPRILLDLIDGTLGRSTG